MKYIEINKLFNLRNGYTPSTKIDEFWENGTISWFKMEDLKKNKRALKKANNKINEKAIKGKGLFKKNSILLATTATIGIHAMLTEDALSNQQFTNFELKEEYKDKLMPEFVYYYFFEIDKWCLKNQKVSSFPSVDMEKLKKVKFPIPPIDIQKDIANKLDKFTEYIDLLNEELSLRQKQYEYYRDKLLTFGDDIKWVEIGDLLEYIQPNKYIVKDVNYNDNYDIPVLTAGQTFILGYTNEKDNIYKASKENPSIIFDDFTASFHWVDFNFKVKSSAMKMLVPKKNKNVNFRYIYHFMKKLNYSSDKHSRLWISVYSKFKIPIPTFEKQREIVNILDKFDTLCADTLPNEIALREKQYGYYRDLLLKF